MYQINMNVDIIMVKTITNIKFTGKDREIPVLNDDSKNSKFSKKALS